MHHPATYQIPSHLRKRSQNKLDNRLWEFQPCSLEHFRQATLPTTCQIRPHLGKCYRNPLHQIASYKEILLLQLHKNDKAL